ncbi:EamA family transporter [Hydrogenophaga bisanensis]|jgi:transporter family protein|uniref:EamA family transporter n=1 Tax=Hydrogenophaga bisanensis TaxID=439611 RepID=A0ABW2RES4_9BURK
MAESGNWLVWALLSAVFAAATAVLAKIGVQGIDSDLATLVRTVVIGVLLSLFVLSTGKWSNPLQLPSRSLLFLFLSAVATGASWVCYFRALQVGPVSLVAPIDKLSVVLVIAFAFMFLGERPSTREWLAVGMIGAGAIMLAFKK